MTNIQEELQLPLPPFFSAHESRARYWLCAPWMFQKVPQSEAENGEDKCSNLKNPRIFTGCVCFFLKRLSCPLKSGLHFLLHLACWIVFVCRKSASGQKKDYDFSSGPFFKEKCRWVNLPTGNISLILQSQGDISINRLDHFVRTSRNKSLKKTSQHIGPGWWDYPTISHVKNSN